MLLTGHWSNLYALIKSLTVLLYLHLIEYRPALEVLPRARVYSRVNRSRVIEEAFQLRDSVRVCGS